MKNQKEQHSLFQNPGISPQEVQRVLITYMQKYGANVMGGASIPPQQSNEMASREALARVSST